MKKLIYLIVLSLILGLVLTGCLLSNVGQVPSSEQSGIAYLTKTLPLTGLVGLWHFDEGSGATASDSSGYGNHGTLINGPLWVTAGKFGDALSFDGVNDYVDCGDVLQLNGVSEFTVEFWIKVDDLPFDETSWQGIIARGNTGQRTPWVFGNQDESNLYMQFKTNAGVADCDLVTNDLTVGQWHHVAFTWDGTTVRSYIDTVAGPTDTTGGSVLADTIGSLKFGYIPGYAHFAGTIDEVRIWNEARTASQIAQSYAALHVDDDWLQWPGAYTTITEALAVAGSGDTIIVHEGTYNEAVIIDNSLTLQGAGAATTTVTGAHTITANDVIIDGFTLDGGITLDDSTNPISGGTISNNIITGADNPITKAQNGIRLGLDSGGQGVDHITIENNTISNNLEKGIRFSNTKIGDKGPQRISYITIRNNEIKDNGSAGIETYGPGSNNITGNTISGNDGNGINLKFDDDDVVTGNIITNNTGPGITLRKVTNSTVENNSVSDHQSDDPVPSCKDVIGGKGSGIHIFDVSENNTIRFNVISGNNYGIFIHSKGNLKPSGNSIAYNSIAGNDIYGILNALIAPPAPVDATNNWWGDASGPSGVGLGTGDEVSSYVEFDPWLGKFLDLLIIEQINSLTKEDFNNQKAWVNQRDALLDKIESVFEQIENFAYKGAINKLEKDIMDKIQKWIIIAKQEKLIELIQDEIDILEGAFE